MPKDNLEIIKVDETETHYSITTDEAIIEIKHQPIKNAQPTEKPQIKTLDLPRAPGIPAAPDIPDVVMNDIDAMLEACINLIKPYTTVFSSAELKRMRRIGMKSRPYFDIVVQYLTNNPDLCPPGLNIGTLKRFLEISYRVEGLRAKVNTLNDMLKMIEAQFESLAYSIFTQIYDFIKVLTKEGNLVAGELANIVKELFKKKKQPTAFSEEVDIKEEVIVTKKE